jgi:hypothetical protein
VIASRRVRFLLGALTAAWIGASPAAAGTEAALVEGAKVRVEAPEVSAGRIQGAVAELRAAALVVSVDGRRVAVPWRAIRRMDVSAGERRHALRGLLIGAGAGALLSIVMPKCVNEGCTSEVGFDPAFALVGALSGSAWGSLIGALVKTEDWKAVSVRLAVAPMPRRGASVAVSIAIR